MRRAVVASGVLAAFAFGASAVPVFSADNGTVNAQVSVTAPAAACLTVPSETIDFGTWSFTPAGHTTFVTASPITLGNCSTGAQTLLGRGTDANGSSATWALTTSEMCPATPDLNKYNLGIENFGALLPVGTTDGIISGFAIGTPLSITPAIRLPCVGSSGAGQTMSMQYVFTAMLA